MEQLQTMNPLTLYMEKHLMKLVHWWLPEPPLACLPVPYRMPGRRHRVVYHERPLRHKS